MRTFAALAQGPRLFEVPSGKISMHAALDIKGLLSKFLPLFCDIKGQLKKYLFASKLKHAILC